MGSAPSSSKDWSSYKTTRKIDTATTDQIYTSSDMKDKFNPAKIALREARDNAAQPETTPIIIALDVTGSMSSMLKEVAKGIGDFVTQVHADGIIKDPQIMLMAIGDVEAGDRAPLQVTQFESDIRIIEQLQELWFEGHGGGNRSESFPLAWHFATNRIETDSFEKRNKKGILISIGNDGLPEGFTKSELLRVYGIEMEAVSTKNVYDSASRMFDIFHIHLKHSNDRDEIDSQRAILGEKVIVLEDVGLVTKTLTGLCMKLKGKDSTEIATVLGDKVASSVSAIAVVQQGTGSELVKF